MEKPLFESVKEEKRALPVFTYYKDSRLSAFDNEIVNAYNNIVYNFIYKKHTICVQGAAGTGKTTLIKELICHLYRRRIYLCAPTHKAVAQFNKIEELLTPAQQLCNQIQIGTLQKGLGLQVEVDEEGNYVYTITRQGELYKKAYEYIIIDEASMVSAEQYYALLELNIPILFIGDKNQLPAINNKSLPFCVFDFYKDTHTIYLFEKRRYSCFRLKELTGEIEKAIEADVLYDDFVWRLLLDFSDVVSGVKGLSKEEVRSLYYIDYTNKGGQYHWLSMEGHYYIKGEVYYSKDVENRKINKRDRYLLVEVEERYLDVLDQRVKYKICLLENLRTGERQHVYCYNPNEEKFFDQAKREIRKWKRRKNKVVSIDLFCNTENTENIEEGGIPYTAEQMKVISQAILLYPDKVYTIHASQGSTFDKVLVNIGSIDKTKASKERVNKEKLQLLYVAISRAREKVYII
ncbi:MAG: AAA family ATPase [Bacteroidia bacterium]|nr:AAA family ATPase [Bacteroidia bacterium]